MGFLSKIFGKSPSVTLAHPVFGELLLGSGATGPYWMHEVYQGDEGISISIETRGTAEPTQSQIEFFQSITSSLDAAIRPALPMLAARYQEVYGKAIPSDWREAFRLAGIGVPLDGDSNSEWDLALECLTNNSQFLFTIYFENGEAAHVSVDT